MPRGIPNKKKSPARAQDTKNMSPEEYEAAFGRKKPGPASGFKKKGAKATVKSTAKAGYFAPGRVKPGPKKGFKKAKKTGLSMDLVQTGRMSSKKATVSNAPKAAKNLGEPPTKKLAGLGAVTQAALNLKEADLRLLYGHIEEKLAGDTSDFGPDEWGAVQELVNSGYSKLNAIESVRADAVEHTNQETNMAEPEENPAIPAPIITDPTDSEPIDEESGDDEDDEDLDEDEEEDGDEETPEPPATAMQP